MAGKDKMVDFPNYNPDERVPFPPPDQETLNREARQARADQFATQGLDTFAVPPDDDRLQNTLEKAPRKKEDKQAAPPRPFYETYDPDPSSPDPSQTQPGEPNIRDPKTKLPEGFDLESLSPDVDLKE